MKIRAFTLSAILLVFLIVTPSLYAQLTGYKIGVDPGHGRSKSGAVGPTGLKEADVNPPTVNILSPVGGEIITAGSRFTIRFAVADNDALSAFIISYSGDGGASFPFVIAFVGPKATEVIWNVPDCLQGTMQGRIRVTVRDCSGNEASAVSGIFTVQLPPQPEPCLRIVITFNPPPPPGQPDLLGYNIYRVLEPPEGQPLPTPDQIVSDPNNLVASVTADATSFTDTVSTSKGNNFVYSITSVFCNGQMSGGSQPLATDLPVIKNPVFEKGTILIDAAGSFIAPSGAMLIVNDSESYPLQFDENGSHFTVPKKAPSSPSGVILKKLIKKGTTVRLTVKNPDGKLSVGVMFTRPK